MSKFFLQIGDVTISMSSEKSSRKSSARHVPNVIKATRAASKLQGVVVTDSDQQNKSKKKEFKQIVKKRKKAGEYQLIEYHIWLV